MASTYYPTSSVTFLFLDVLLDLITAAVWASPVLGWEGDVVIILLTGLYDDYLKPFFV